MVCPTGLRARGRVFQVLVCPKGPGGFVFEYWSAQRAWGGFVFEYNGSGRVSDFLFSMVCPTGLRARGRVFSSTGLPKGPGGDSFLSTGLPKGPGGDSFLSTGPPNPFGFPRTPNPKGTFAPFCATKCDSSRVYMYVRPVRIACFARFCAEKMLLVQCLH